MKEKIIDLTHSLSNNISVYPGTSAPQIKQTNSIKKDGFAETAMHIRTHSGTHIDAPSHIVPDSRSIDEIPLEKFIGEGLIVDCSDEDSISLELLKSMEDKMMQVDFVLFYSGWHKKWCSTEYFNDYPVLDKEAIDYLLKFNLKAVGFDVVSVDKMNSIDLPNHHIFLENDILIIENLTNLDKLIGLQFEFNCIPLKIEGADGSPVRAFARINK